MKKYRTPKGNIYDENTLRSKYGDKFDLLVSKGYLTEVSDGAPAQKNEPAPVQKKQPALTGNTYRFPNGYEADEAIIRAEYGDDKFDAAVAAGALKKKEPAVSPSAAPVSSSAPLSQSNESEAEEAPEAAPEAQPAPISQAGSAVQGKGIEMDGKPMFLRGGRRYDWEKREYIDDGTTPTWKRLKANIPTIGLQYNNGKDQKRAYAVKVDGENYAILPEYLPEGYSQDLAGIQKFEFDTQNATDKQAAMQALVAATAKSRGKYDDGIREAMLTDEDVELFDMATGTVGLQATRGSILADPNKSISDLNSVIERTKGEFSEQKKKLLEESARRRKGAEVDLVYLRQLDALEKEEAAEVARIKGLITKIKSETQVEVNAEQMANVESADTRSDLASFWKKATSNHVDLIFDALSRTAPEKLGSSFHTGLAVVGEEKPHVADRLKNGKTLSSTVVADITNRGVQIRRAQNYKQLLAGQIDIKQYLEKEQELGRDQDANFWSRPDIVQSTIGSILAEYHAAARRGAVNRVLNTAFGEWHISDREIDETPLSVFHAAGIDTNRKEFKEAIQRIKDAEGILPFQNGIAKDGLTREFLKGAWQPIQGTANFFGNIGVGENERRLQGELSAVANYTRERTKFFEENVGVAADALNGFGQFMTQYLLMEGGVGLFRGMGAAFGGRVLSAAERAGIRSGVDGAKFIRGGTAPGNFVLDKSSIMAQIGVPFVQSFDDYYKQGLDKTNNRAAALLYGFTNASMEAASELMFDNIKFGRELVKNFSGKLSPNQIAKYLRGGFTEASKKELQGYFKDLVASSMKQVAKGGLGLAKEAFEEVPVALTNFIMDAALNPASVEGRDVFEEMKDAFVGGLVSFSIPSILGTVGRIRNNKQIFEKQRKQSAMLLTAARNKTDVIDAIKNLAEDGDLSVDEMNAKIKMVNTAAQELSKLPGYSDGSPMLEKDKAAYLAASVKEKYLEEEVSGLAKEDPIRQEAEKQMSSLRDARARLIRQQITPEEDKLYNELVSKQPGFFEAKEGVEPAPAVKKSGLEYAAEKAAEDPAAFIDYFGKDAFFQIIKYVPADVLRKKKEYLEENYPGNRSIGIIDNLLTLPGYDAEMMSELDGPVATAAADDTGGAAAADTGADTGSDTGGAETRSVLTLADIDLNENPAPSMQKRALFLENQRRRGIEYTNREDFEKDFAEAHSNQLVDDELDFEEVVAGRKKGAATDTENKLHREGRTGKKNFVPSPEFIERANKQGFEVERVDDPTTGAAKWVVGTRKNIDRLKKTLSKDKKWLQRNGGKEYHQAWGEFLGYSQEAIDHLVDKNNQGAGTTVEDMIDRRGSFRGGLGIFQYDQEEDEVLFKPDGGGRIFVLGKYEDVYDTPIEDFGIEQEESVVELGDDGSVYIRGDRFVNNYSDPMMAVTRTADGGYSVELETPDGKIRTIRGSVAEDLVYQYTLKNIYNEREQFEQFIAEDGPAQAAIEAGGFSEASQEDAAKGDGDVQRETLEAKSESLREDEKQIEEDAKKESEEVEKEEAAPEVKEEKKKRVRAVADEKKKTAKEKEKAEKAKKAAKERERKKAEAAKKRAKAKAEKEKEKARLAKEKEEAKAEKEKAKAEKEKEQAKPEKPAQKPAETNPEKPKEPTKKEVREREIASYMEKYGISRKAAVKLLGVPAKYKTEELQVSEMRRIIQEDRKDQKAQEEIKKAKDENSAAETPKRVSQNVDPNTPAVSSQNPDAVLASTANFQADFLGDVPNRPQLASSANMTVAELEDMAALGQIQVDEKVWADIYAEEEGGYITPSTRSLIDIAMDPEMSRQKRGAAVALILAARMNMKDDFLSGLFRKVGKKIYVYSSKGTEKNPNDLRISASDGNNAININAANIAERMLEFGEESKFFAWSEMALYEEVIHLATFTVASSEEIAAIGRELTPEQRKFIQELYGSNFETVDPNTNQRTTNYWALGAEYVRLVTQNIVYGLSTEMLVPTSLMGKGNVNLVGKDQNAKRTFFAKLLQFIKGVFVKNRAVRNDAIANRVINELTRFMRTGEIDKRDIEKGEYKKDGDKYRVKKTDLVVYEKTPSGQNVFQVIVGGKPVYIMQFDSALGSGIFIVKKTRSGEWLPPYDELDGGFIGTNMAQAIANLRGRDMGAGASFREDPAVRPQDMTSEQYADMLSKMTRDQLDEVDFYENYPGYVLYEARKLMPKQANSTKFKKITDSNSNTLGDEYHYIANIDGEPYGLTKQEDPDDPDNDKAFVWAYEKVSELSNANNKLEITTTSDNDELVRIIRDSSKGREAGASLRKGSVEDQIMDLPEDAKDRITDKMPDLYEWQDSTVEGYTKKGGFDGGGYSTGNSNVWGFKVENAGDIFRELTKYVNTFIDPGYLYEKVNLIRDFIEARRGVFGIERNRNFHTDDTWDTWVNKKGSVIRKAAMEWSNMQPLSEAQEVAKSMVLGLLNGNLNQVETGLEYFDKLRQADDVKAALMKANEYNIYKAYTIAKETGSNPDLVNAVERELVGRETGASFRAGETFSENEDNSDRIAREILDSMLKANLIKKRSKRPTVKGDPIKKFKLSTGSSIVQDVLVTHIGRDLEYMEAAEVADYIRGTVLLKQASIDMNNLVDEIFAKHDFDTALGYLINSMMDDTVELTTRNLLSVVMIRRLQYTHPDIANYIRGKIDPELATKSALALGSRRQHNISAETVERMVYKSTSKDKPNNVDLYEVFASDDASQALYEQLANVRGGRELLEAVQSIQEARRRNSVKEREEVAIADLVDDLQARLDLANAVADNAAALLDKMDKAVISITEDDSKLAKEKRDAVRAKIMKRRGDTTKTWEETQKKIRETINKIIDTCSG